jgi:DNA sulfur modification protein DndC
MQIVKNIKEELIELYRSDSRPWLVGFSGGKDSTMVASIIFEVILAIPEKEREKEVHIVCTDTRVEIPAIVEIIQKTLKQMEKFSNENNLKIEVHLLRPATDDSFWVNIIGRGYPPPNRNFRWCTQRLKIDPVNRFIEKRITKWGEAILHLGSRRTESPNRAKTMINREQRNGLTRHPNLPRVWISNPIQYLTTEQVWAYLLQHKNPWGGNNEELYRLYSKAGGGECPLQIDTNAPACGNSRFGCWTCTVVERDKTSEGLLESGDEKMELLLNFRDTLLEFRNPENGFRDTRRMNGNMGPGPLTIDARRELLKKLIDLQQKIGIELITHDELFLIQQFWKSARNPDDGYGVWNIVNGSKEGFEMNYDEKEKNWLKEIEEDVAKELNINLDTLQRLVAKVEQYKNGGNNIKHEELLNIIKDDLNNN